MLASGIPTLSQAPSKSPFFGEEDLCLENSSIIMCCGEVESCNFAWCYTHSSLFMGLFFSGCGESSNDIFLRLWCMRVPRLKKTHKKLVDHDHHFKTLLVWSVEPTQNGTWTSHDFRSRFWKTQHQPSWFSIGNKKITLGNCSASPAVSLSLP